MKLIGFLANKSNGKDTAGDYLVNKYGYIKKCFAVSVEPKLVKMRISARVVALK